MTLAPIAIPTYKRMFLQSEPTLLSTLSLIRDFIRYRALKSKLGMCWIVFSMLFIISFPTISGAMTSYSQNTLPFILDSEGKYVPYGSINTVDYVIYDAKRIPGLDLDEPYIVSISDDDAYSDG
jgi:hypothetical protein